LPSSQTSTGISSSPTGGPGQRAARSSASAAIQSCEIWLRVRKMLSARALASPRCPSITPRVLGGAVAMPRSPPMRSLASAATLVSTSGFAAARAWKSRDAMLATRVGSVAR